MVRAKKSTQKDSTRTPTTLSTFTAASLVLPGLMQTSAKAADEDEVDFQYSHYQEGNRSIYGLVDHDNDFDTADITGKLPQNLNPIEVDSLHGRARFSLTDRVKFAFNYLQDTWSGATPIGTAPQIANGNHARYKSVDSQTGQVVGTVTGASPFLYFGSVSTFFIDKNLGNYYASIEGGRDGGTPGAKNNQLTHVLSYASPETRKQGDFKLSYQWDEAELTIGGGISVENDYESRFGNLGGRFDFNQKQTSVNWGVSYTNSDTSATLDHDGLGFFVTDAYDNGICDFNTGELIPNTPESFRIVPAAHSGRLVNSCGYDSSFGAFGRTSANMQGNRQDWGGQLGLAQVLDKDSFLSLDLSYTRSTGYLANPYKVVYGYEFLSKPGEKFLQQIVYFSNLAGYLEVRPDERNLFNWHLGFDRFIEPLDAALHFNYHFAHDDWGINAHTFDADWVQLLGDGWTVTPRIRYYSQSAADFYTTGMFKIYKPNEDGSNTVIQDFPKHYSSDQRLSGFGTMSGGVTLEKKFSNGVSLETGFEYYSHQGGLKLGEGGEGDFADFDYWVANAALKVKLDALNAPGSGHAGHDGHHHHSNSPAGVMFDHTLPKAGDFMAGYRFMRSDQNGDMLFSSHPVSLDTVNLNGCEGRECAVTPKFMAMNMHMLDLMYAPSDWLTLMLMPQWMDMEMTMTANENVQITGGHGGHAGHDHETGGFGDLGFYALFKPFDHPNHHLTVSVGGTAPTGDVDIALRKTGINPVDDQLIHYGMQLGSGTWDFKPALTYTGNADNFLWGAQANVTVRLKGQNKSGYRLGDIFQGSVWGGYHFTHWLAGTMRGIYTWQDSIHGRLNPSQTLVSDPNTGELVPFASQHIGSFDFPGNYGGQFVDLGLGVNFTVPSGAFAGNSLKFEWLQPLHTDYNGYQLDRDYALNFTWSYGF
jgi:Protein of unknown function (DUF3570)